MEPSGPSRGFLTIAGVMVAAMLIGFVIVIVIIISAQVSPDRGISEQTTQDDNFIEYLAYACLKERVCYDIFTVNGVPCIRESGAIACDFSKGDITEGLRD